MFLNLNYIVFGCQHSTIVAHFGFL